MSFQENRKRGFCATHFPAEIKEGRIPLNPLTHPHRVLISALASNWRGVPAGSRREILFLAKLWLVIQGRDHPLTLFVPPNALLGCKIRSKPGLPANQKAGAERALPSVAYRLQAGRLTQRDRFTGVTALSQTQQTGLVAGGRRGGGGYLLCSPRSFVPCI